MAGFWENLMGGGAKLGGYASLLDRLGDQRKSSADTIGGMQDAIGGKVEFQPWSVRSGLGQTSYQDGNLSVSLSDQQQGYADFQGQGGQQMFGNAMGMDSRFSQGQQAFSGNAYEMGGRSRNAFGSSQQAMQNSMQDTTQREGDIYSRIRAMQAPGEQRQQDSMNAGLFGSGRGGMTSAAYGGSPEQHAFGMAQSEARNAASFQAMGQAQTEMMNQGNLASQYGNLSNQYFQTGSQSRNMGMNALTQGGQYQQTQGNIAQQMFGNQYQPQDQLRQFGQQGIQNQQMRSQSGMNMAGLLAQLGIGGMTTDVNFANVQGQAMTGMMEALGTAGGGIGDALSDYFGWGPK